MSYSKLSFKKSSVQLLKPAGSTGKPSLTNVAVCSGCHGCTGGTRAPADPYTNPAPLGDKMKIGW